MDVSKLPRLSNTSQSQPSPEQEQLPPPSAAAPAVGAKPSFGVETGAEAWISIAIGVILLFMTSRFLQFLASKLTGAAFTWTFSDADGGPLSYTQTIFFWNDLGIVVFAGVLILEGIVLAWLRRYTLLMAVFILTLMAIALNLFSLAKAMPIGGFQLYPAVAVAYGVYIAMHEWALLKLARS